MEHLRMSADYPDEIVIENVSKPDSAFGLYYLSSKDKRIITKVMHRVSDTIMQRTQAM